MGGVTKEQLERARQLPVLDYILLNESGDYKRIGNGCRLKADNSLAVDIVIQVENKQTKRRRKYEDGEAYLSFCA